jgi:DNA polymerase-3 subunit alpha
MFPGDSQAVLYFKDTKLRRGARCAIDTRMLGELKNVLGEGNVVVK